MLDLGSVSWLAVAARALRYAVRIPKVAARIFPVIGRVSFTAKARMHHRGDEAGGSRTEGNYHNTNSARYVRNVFVLVQAPHICDQVGTVAPTPAAYHNLRKMEYPKPHANYNRHMENIAAAAEGEREAMEAAEEETRRATKKWRKFTLWLSNDTKRRKLPSGNWARRFDKAKAVWWASKAGSDWLHDIDYVIADSGDICLPVAEVEASTANNAEADVEAKVEIVNMGAAVVDLEAEVVDREAVVVLPERHS